MNCAQVLASNSAAQSGRGMLLARGKRVPVLKGKYDTTPIFRSWASGRIFSSALRLSME
jgi:hypothetical protein